MIHKTCVSCTYLSTSSIASAIDVDPLSRPPFALGHTLCFLQYEDHRLDQHQWNVRDGLYSLVRCFQAQVSEELLGDKAVL